MAKVDKMRREDVEGKARVELFDGSIQGTVIEAASPYFWRIRWDDGEESAVHPLDVKHLTLDIIGDTKMDGCQTIPGASAEYTAMCGEGQRFGRVEDY